MPCWAASSQILGVMPARQDAAVDHRMQRLDAAVHHFGKAGDVGDVGHRAGRRRPAPGRCRRSTPARNRARPALGRKESGPTYQKRSKSLDASTALSLRKRVQNGTRLKDAKKRRRSELLFSIDFKCNGPVSSPKSISADQKAASCGLFLLPLPHPEGAMGVDHYGGSATCTTGRERCALQARSSGSTTPRATVSSSAKAEAMYSCTTRRSRAPVSARSKRDSRLSLKSSTGPRVLRPATSPALPGPA